MILADCIDHGHRGTPRGYLRLKIGIRNEYAHRHAYAVANSVSMRSLDGVVVRHTCDNSRCINPNHLVTGTHMDNVLDQVVRKRNPKLPRVFTPEQRATIRSRYQPGDKHNGMSAMAREMVASTATIWRIVHGT